MQSMNLLICMPGQETASYVWAITIYGIRRKGLKEVFLRYNSNTFRFSVTVYRSSF